MKKNNILDNVIVLSAFGIPFFAVEDRDDIDELKSIIKIRPKIVSGLNLIEEPNLVWLEEYLEKIDNGSKLKTLLLIAAGISL